MRPPSDRVRGVRCFRQRAWRMERDALAQTLLDEIAGLGYDRIVERFVVPEASEYREVTAPSGRIYTLQVEAWWEDEEARSVHLSVVGNRGRGLRFSGAGPWMLVDRPGSPT